MQENEFMGVGDAVSVRAKALHRNKKVSQKSFLLTSLSNPHLLQVSGLTFCK